MVPLCPCATIMPPCYHYAPVLPLCPRATIMPPCYHYAPVLPLCPRATIMPLCYNNATIMPPCYHYAPVLPLCPRATIMPLCYNNATIMPPCYHYAPVLFSQRWWLDLKMRASPYRKARGLLSCVPPSSAPTLTSCQTPPLSLPMSTWRATLLPVRQAGRAWGGGVGWGGVRVR